MVPRGLVILLVLNLIANHGQDTSEFWDTSPFLDESLVFCYSSEARNQYSSAVASLLLALLLSVKLFHVTVVGVFDLQRILDQWLHELAEFLLGLVPMFVVSAVSTGFRRVPKLAQGFVSAPVVSAPLCHIECVAGIFTRLVRLASLTAEQGTQIESVALHQPKPASRGEAQCLLAILDAPLQPRLGKKSVGEVLAKSTLAKDSQGLTYPPSGGVKVTDRQVEFPKENVALRDGLVPLIGRAESLIRCRERARRDGVVSQPQAMSAPPDAADRI